MSQKKGTRAVSPRRVFDSKHRPPTLSIRRKIGFYSAFGYNSAFTASREGRGPTAGSGDRHQLLDRTRLYLQSRDFMRNNGIFKGMIDRATSYVMGNGFGLVAKSASDPWNLRAENIWRKFWKKPEIRQMHSGRQVERLIAKELLAQGDVGAILTDQNLLQLVEAEQIVGPNLLGIGIEIDRWGKPKTYMVCPYGKAGAPLISLKQDIPPEDFLHIHDTERVSSTRGVPPCQAAFPMLHRINDVCDSEAIAWQMISKMAVSINRKDASLLAPSIARQDTDNKGDLLEGDATKWITELDSAIIFHGEPGEEVKGIERNIPSQSFSESLTMFLRLLGLPLGLPLEVILLDWTKSNYSQSRAVLEQAFVTFLSWQFLIEDSFHRPIYEWVIEKAIADGELDDRVDKFDHEWIKPTFPWIDQLKEAEAQAAKLDRGFSTHADVLKGLGIEREDLLKVREAEIREAIKISEKIKADTGIDVPWQYFAGLEVAPQGPKNPFVTEEPGKGGASDESAPAKPAPSKPAKAPSK